VSTPLSMFHEKSSSGNPYSMTRVVAFLFALTYCAVLYKNSNNFHILGWPACALGVATLLAVPIQAMCRALQSYLESSPGQRLLHVLLEKVSPSLAAGITTETTATTATATTTTKGEG
jgi:hypothetical protein